MVRPGKGHHQRLGSQIREFVGGELSVPKVEVATTSFSSDQPPQTDFCQSAYDGAPENVESGASLSEVV